MAVGSIPTGPTTKALFRDKSDLMAGELVTETFDADGGRASRGTSPRSRPEAVVSAGDGQLISPAFWPGEFALMVAWAFGRLN